jgi:DNA-binding NtrC family response regulator
MADSNSSPLVLVVHDDAGVAEALAIALESIGATAVQLTRAHDARMVIQGAPSLTTVMSRCVLDLDGDRPLLGWAGEHRPDVALIALCSTVGHDHADLPAWCQVLSAPFDSQDLKRTLAEARLAAFEGLQSP